MNRLRNNTKCKEMFREARNSLLNDSDEQSVDELTRIFDSSILEPAKRIIGKVTISQKRFKTKNEKRYEKVRKEINILKCQKNKCTDKISILSDRLKTIQEKIYIFVH